MTKLHLDEIVALGIDRRRGNLLGIQPYLLVEDYASPATLRAKLDGYLAVAAERGWLNPKTIVVWPEHIGTWLVVAGEGQLPRRAGSVQLASFWLVLRHPIGIAKGWLMAWGRARLRDAIFRVKAQMMARAYQQLFGSLAQHYGVTIVGGSIILPGPFVANGRLKTSQSALYNVSLLFHPDGAPDPQLVRKNFPTWDEQEFIAPGLPFDLPVFETPAGRLGVLICADAWYPIGYERLTAQGATLLAVPSFLTGHQVWNQPWEGYNGSRAPGDVDYRDLDRISEGEAWLKYAMPARILRSGLEVGINVFLRGRLWDLGGDGHTLIVHQGTFEEAQHVHGAAIVNRWL
jgi:hypothetical protein